MPDSPEQVADRIDLLRVIRSLWARRLPILLIATACAVAGYALGALLIKSRADSFLQVSYTAPVTVADEKLDRENKDSKEGKELQFRTNIAEYKVLSAAVLAREGFLEYAARSGKLDASLIGELNADIAKNNLLARWVRPVFALARSDLREIPDQPRDEANYLVGLDISVERRSPEQALAIAGVLGDYARDSALQIRAREFASGMYYKASSRLLDLDRHVITTRLALAQAEAKQQDLVAIRNRYPEAARGDVRLVAVDKTTSRFLPPVAQLVGTESQIAEIHETLRIAEWDIERSKALIAFLEPVQAIVRDSRSGNDLFPKLDKLMSDTFDAKRLAADPWRDAFSTLKLEVFRLKTLYFERMRFIAAPTLNEIPLWWRLLPALAGFIAGAVLAALGILLREHLVPAATRAGPRLPA
jgi:hypothetical protein